MLHSNELRKTGQFLKIIQYISLIILLGPSHFTFKILCEGFLPENNLKIEINHNKMAFQGVTEIQFNQVIDRIQQIYSPIVSRYGGRLVIQKNWQDSTVNAYAQREGGNFIVRMLGGLARHQEMTPDGLALVVCHEIGHHIGGVPRYAGNWASSEGQSDYFATLKCLREVWQDEDNQKIVASMQIPQSVTAKCQKTFSNADDLALCQRSSIAGMSGSRLFWSLSGGGRTPAFDTPDASKVTSHMESHPPYQCRLDTYFNGSYCEADYRGEIGQSDPKVGVCHNYDNGNASNGERPRCWYAYSSSGGGNPQPGGDIASNPLINGQVQFQTRNPNQVIPISINVSNVQGAAGVLLEISKPNRIFTNPNGNAPDPVGGLGFESARGTVHTYQLLPVRQLPGPGTYQIRLLGLDANGRAVGKFSNPSTLVLLP